MKNMNKKSIKIGFKILSILAFSLIFIPINGALAAVYPTYVVGGFSDDQQTYTFGHFVWSDDPDAIGNGGTIGGGTNGSDGSGSTSDGTFDWGTSGVKKNPVPKISSISPKSGNVNMTTNTITITGRNFTPNSVARINTSVRPVTFIDPSHLLLSINSNDLYMYQNNGGFFVTVFNEAPGGGYSNGKYFTIKAVKGSGTINKDGSGSSAGGSLAANAFFGSGSILPSGLVSWIILGIMILIIVILARKVFGAEKRYHQTPLKHA